MIRLQLIQKIHVFSLDKNTQNVTYHSRTRNESSNYSFDDFIIELNKSMKEKEDKNISSQIYQAPPSPTALPPFVAGSVAMAVNQQVYRDYDVSNNTSQITTAPCQNNSSNQLYWPPPTTAIPPLTFNFTTLPTIYGGQITYPSNFLHTVPGLSLNPHRQAYSSPVLNTTFTALPYGAVGGSTGAGYRSGSVYGVSYMAPSQMSSPGTAVYGAYSRTGPISCSNSLG